MALAPAIALVAFRACMASACLARLTPASPTIATYTSTSSRVSETRAEKRAGGERQQGSSVVRQHDMARSSVAMASYRAHCWRNETWAAKSRHLPTSCALSLLTPSLLLAPLSLTAPPLLPPPAHRAYTHVRRTFPVTSPAANATTLSAA